MLWRPFDYKPVRTGEFQKRTDDNMKLQSIETMLNYAGARFCAILERTDWLVDTVCDQVILV